MPDDLIFRPDEVDVGLWINLPQSPDAMYRQPLDPPDIRVRNEAGHYIVASNELAYHITYMPKVLFA